MIANYIPFEHPAGGPNYYNFGTGIRYEIHVKNNATTTGDESALYTGFYFCSKPTARSNHLLQYKIRQTKPERHLYMRERYLMLR